MDEKKPNTVVEDEELDDEDFDDDNELDEDDIDDEDVSDDDFEDDDEEDEEPSSEESQEDEEKEREKAKNARFAEMRRKKEAEEKAKREAKEREKEQKIRDDATLKAKLDVIKTNPYTDEPIVDEEDLKIYEIQRKLDDEGKDPVSDLPKRLAEIRRAELRKAKEESEKKEKEEKERSEKITAEIAELVKKYPKLNTAQLADDPLYQECMKGRAGRWTQVEIYELYLEKKKAEKEKEVVEKNGSKISKTPSSKANGAVTSKDISSMSDEEFEKYWKEHYAN